ncbi:ABC transporter ATP-binding protein [Prescottella equi]|uniref:ATP-binding cassette domain-containing protein n=1 Tax=Rhodococcus hoagii TaxID=43767 RepID=A0A9Q2UZR4_RHOHA|nr:ABC transporter ATP-binding protein [Prescottella equi]MBM4480494.1 ATP-binding cassette domain-containing protein [Prescottella equi]MBM4487102.1 ATP-binding cassette domain-containing protein [Prescottella equi]MBM4500001.1 ATP-binding cassette domain-containing protein [Prescottella equi]MBM4505186.1 ATP-binding cassette domain-containing protein [Prescottella equi]MBM4509731.1 ATP-binding cassette domain-containing protein [Prescottella equi]
MAEVPVVELATVTKSFGTRRVLDGIDLAVRQGEFVSVIGPSGCGKSTVFGIVAGLDSPDSGSVSAPTCAHMPQKDLLFPWRSVLDNTALGLEVQRLPKKQARARAAELFPRFGLAGFEDARPHQLSGGMRQRAALLRTVVQDRSVLLLDEPFGALDSLTRTEMQTWLQDVWQQYRWTVLMITHDVREAVFLSDRVIVLSARPATVRREVVVDLPRPRELPIVTSPEFAAVERELIEVLHEESRRALAEQEAVD